MTKEEIKAKGESILKSIEEEKFFAKEIAKAKRRMENKKYYKGRR